MKILSYNINRFTQEKIDKILQFNADVYILPEIACPAQVRLSNIDSNQNHNMKYMRRFMRFNQKLAPAILFFLIAAMLCIPLCSRAHYSGVLSYTKMMKITRDDGTVDSLKVPIFTVDYNGSISVESMKDTPYYSWADECDNEPKDGLLKCDEINPFLFHFRSMDIETNVNTMVYYQEANGHGVIVKNCSVLKRGSPDQAIQQCVMEFDNEGNLKTQILYCIPGTEYEGSYTYNLTTGYVKAVLDDGTVIISRPMKSKNYDNARGLADIIMNQKETKLSKLRRLLITGDMSILADIVFIKEFLLVFVFILFLTSSLVRYFYLPHDGTYGFKGVSEDLTGDAG